MEGRGQRAGKRRCFPFLETGILRYCTEGRAADMLQPISDVVIRVWTHPMGDLVIALQLAGSCGRR